MVLKNLMKLCMPDFLGKAFLPQKLGNGPKIGQKLGFLNLKKSLVINFPWICSIMKIYIICCVPVQTFYWEKCCSWDIGQNALSCSDCRISKSSISPEQIDETASYCACWYKFRKIKSWLKIFWWGMVKNECGQSGF